MALAVPIVLAQDRPDTAAIGGLEVMTPYAEGYNSVTGGSDGTDGEDLLVDSAHFIPGHALYGDFDTEVIFERSARANRDSTVLEISSSACDHEFPVCGELNSPFGPRHRRMHYGIDIDLQRGDPVVSAFEGVVRVSRFHKQFGHVVVVRHANGLETLYGHLSERKVQAGDHVEAGELLGLGGSTGRSTGDHLHFETRYLGQPIDPQLLFNVREGELRTTTLNVHPGLFSAVAKAKASLRQGSHTVRRGETLSSIARTHRTTVKALCRLNRIRSTSTLRVGQRLRY
jgi:murein DD-endopeptidase MepM/ murein hydrolase activator NlpD